MIEARRAVPPLTPALRLARRAWRLQHLDSARAIGLAERALALALAGGDALAEGWARLSRGHHLMYFATPAAAVPELRAAEAAFVAAGERPGQILAGAGLARCEWREGRVAQALQLALGLRDEGLRLLRHDERGLLLNTIAGCHSAQGDSEQAFAYMYEALRDVGPRRGRGYDAVLHCNLAHELMQLGDGEEALRHIDLGLARCADLHHPRLLGILLTNRVTCLTELGRATQALPDVARVVALSDVVEGRGSVGTRFEALAIAALSAGEPVLGAALVARAQAAPRAAIADEHVELAVAVALLAQAGADGPAALRALDGAQRWSEPHDGAEPASLRVRCLTHLLRCELHEQRGDAPAALAELRAWQAAQTERAGHASRARYQAAALQTELLRLQQQLEDNVDRRRTTERARAALQHANEALSRKVHEVEALQEALRGQASRDFLTGLFNRRHLNDALPALLALALRDGAPLAVALIDLDHFKAVNDRHGHGVGDAVLAGFGRLLAAAMRKSDIACRYGGEEFCLLMPHTSAAAAGRKLEAMLERWRATAFAHADGESTGLTFSAGVVDTAQQPGEMGALLAAADAALLDAKRGGRDRVVACQPAPTAR